jgi:hypothetical protein
MLHIPQILPGSRVIKIDICSVFMFCDYAQKNIYVVLTPSLWSEYFYMKMFMTLLGIKIKQICHDSTTPFFYLHMLIFAYILIGFVCLVRRI